MKITASTFIILTSLLTTTHADTLSQEIINVNGREVLLKDDGTWEFLSTDRYANTKNGIRVRLKDDGSWQTIGNAPLQTKEQVRTTNLDINLQKVVIETYEKKVQKNTRIKTQTIFYVKLAYSPQAKNTITVSNNDMSLIEVKDNNGKNYPVVSIHPTDAELQPGTKIILVIRAEKSPSIFDDVKSMAIVFKNGIFGITQPVTLSQRTIDFDKESVDGF